MIGYVSGGVSILHYMDSFHILVNRIQSDISNGLFPFPLVIILGLSTMQTTAMMFAYYEKDQQMRHLRQIIRPRNYFWCGFVSAIIAFPLSIAILLDVFSGNTVALSQLLSWFQDQGGG